MHSHLDASTHMTIYLTSTIFRCNSFGLLFIIIGCSWALDGQVFVKLKHFRKQIKGSLSSSWMNSPIPSLLLPLWQNGSLCETIGMKIWCHLYSHPHENQVTFMIFMGNVLHKHSLCKWKLRRWKSKSAYTLLFYKNVVFPAQAEYSYFSVDFRLKTFLYYS